MRLNDSSVRSLAAPEKGQKTYRCDSLPGFGVRVSQGGTKTFVLMLGKDRQLVSIGRYPIISLLEARTVARERLAERTLGKHRPARLKMSEALKTFYAEKEAKNKASTLAITRGILEGHFKHLHAKALEDIHVGDVVSVTDRLIRDGYPSAANHALTAIRTFLRWCSRRAYIRHSPIADIDKPSKLVSRERVLNDEELRAVWKATGNNSTFSNIVRLLLLTGQRRSEIGSLRAEWCDLGGEESRKGVTLYAASASHTAVVLPPSQSAPENTDCEVMGDGTRNSMRMEPRDCSKEPAPHQCTITIPSARTKNGRVHVFPISRLSSDLIGLSIGQQPSGVLFPARGSQDNSKPFSGWSKSKSKLDAVAKIAPYTLHDLRRTYATNLQRLDVKLEVIEALLNHVSGTRAGIVGVYNRHRYEAEMRAAVTLFETWFTAHIIGMRKSEESTSDLLTP